MEGTFALEDEKADKLKSEKSDKPTLGVSANSTFSVIGYSKNNNDSLYLGDICVTEKEGKIASKETYMYFSHILNDQVKIKIKAKDKADAVSVLGISIPFIKRNYVLADSTQVSSQMDINTSTWLYGVQFGNSNTDRILYRDSNESDPTYNRFTIKTHYETTAYNGSHPTALLVTHDLPFSADQIEDWEPASTANFSGSMTVSIPWGLSHTMSASGHYDITEAGSQTDDYGKWQVDPWLLAEWLDNPERFTPSTAWLSTGTYAGIDSIVYMYYYDNVNYGPDVRGSQTVNVRYDY